MKVNSKILLLALFTVLIVLFSASIGNAATRTATSSGNWNNTSTWGGASVPTATDDVIIRNNATVTVNISNAVCASLSIGDGWFSPGTLSFSNPSSKLKVGDFVKLGGTWLSAGSINMTNGGTLQIGGVFSIPDLGTFTPGTGTIEYNGAGNQSILSNSDLGNKTYYNLITSTGGSKTLYATTTVSGTLGLTGGLLVNGSFLNLADGATISRSQGSLMSAPTFAGTINLIYTGTSPIISGKEMPVSAGVLNNLKTNSGGVIQAETPGAHENILTDAFENLLNWTGNIGGSYNEYNTLNSSYAGGSPNETRYAYGSSANTNYTASIYRVVNTTGYTSLNISWKHFIDNWDASYQPYTVKVQCAASSSGPWTDMYSLSPTGTGNVGPENISLTNWTTNVGGNFYIRYYITGYTYGLDFWYFDDLIIETPAPGTASTVTINGTLDLSSGTYSINDNNLILIGAISGSSAIIGSSTSNLSVEGSGTNLVIPSISNGLNNFSINRASGVSLNGDLTVNGILKLQSANASSSQGSLHLGSNTLTMGLSATTIGAGDVTGIVSRTSFLPDIAYSFGNQFTFIAFNASGTIPSQIQAKISIGAAPSWKPTAIKRMYDIIQTGGINCLASITTHYLDSELNGLNENSLTQWTYGNPGPPVGLFDWGSSNRNSSENWIEISNINIAHFPTVFGQLENTLGVPDVVGYQWNGSVSTVWTNSANWTPAGIPSSISEVLVPDASSTTFSPSIPANTEIKSLTIAVNGVVNAIAGALLTLNGSNGAWNNIGGTFNPNTSTITFTNTAATLSGSSSFYNVIITSGSELWMTSGSTMRIAGTISNSGMWRTIIGSATTIEYNGGNQTIINPNGPTTGYYNLILSGSGTKTMPASAVTIASDFSMSGTASAAILANITVVGNSSLSAGNTLNLGAFNNTFGGNITNGGTLSSSSSSITLNGSVAQTLTSSTGISFNNFNITNISAPVTLGTATNCSIANNLSIATNAIFDLGLNSLSVTNSVSSTGTVITQNTSTTPFPSNKTWGGSFVFAGSGAQTVVSGTYNDFTISGTGGATANADITVNGVLKLVSANPSATKGLLDMGSHTVLMGPLATNIGVGDVSGIVRRTSINANTIYTFGNEFTSIFFPIPLVGTLPTELSLKTTLGSSPTWKPNAINRIYDFIHVGGGGTQALIHSHYLESELNGNAEDAIINYLYVIPTSQLIEYGRAAYNTEDNWVAISNVDLDYFQTSFGLMEVSMAEYQNLALTWNGSVSTSWVTAANWTPNGAPSDHTALTIPDASTTNFDLSLPIIATCGSIKMESGAIINTSSGAKLTINNGTGAWTNQGGTLNPGNSTIVFNNSGATMSGSTDFYDLYMDIGAVLSLENNAYMGISGSLTNNGKINTISSGATTVDYKGGDQTVVIPDRNTYSYSTLKLSGSGTKTMPAAALQLIGNFDLSGSATTTSNYDLTVVGDLYLSNTSSLTINDSTTLTVSGSIVNSVGVAGLTLLSSADGTAALIHNTNNVAATVQRYISGAAEAWHFISSPVSNQSISGDWLPSGSYGNGTGYDMYLWNEATFCWIYQLDVSSTINWNTVHPGTDFIPGRGYLYSLQALNPTKAFVGNLNNGPLNYGLTIGASDLSLKGFNLSGNPYPSSIDWQSASGWGRTNLVESASGYHMWIWNPTANNYGVCNSYTGVTTNGISRYIAPMQGFFVRAESAGNLSMDNDIRVLTDASNWFKSEYQEKQSLSLSVISNDGYGSDEVKISFGYAENEQGAKKLFSNSMTAPSLYMGGENKYLSISYLSSTEENSAIPILFKAGVNGVYSILSNIDPIQFDTALLQDLKTGTIQNMLEKDTYRFKSSTKDSEHRFVLHFKQIDINSGNDFPAKIYKDGNQLIVDLNLIDKVSELMVYNTMGELLLQDKLDGKTLHKFYLNAPMQILIVHIENPDGSLSQKILWHTN